MKLVVTLSEANMRSCPAEVTLAGKQSAEERTISSNSSMAPFISSVSSANLFFSTSNLHERHAKHLMPACSAVIAKQVVETARSGDAIKAAWRSRLLRSH